MKKTAYIWKNGEFLKWDEATTHVLTHALHYGTAVFEGIRAYETPKGPAIFKGKAHMDRLIDSARIYKFESPYSADEFLAASKTLIQKNNLRSCYIRPLIYVGYGPLGIIPHKQIDAIVGVWEWGTYLGEEGLENGVRCQISSWARIDSRVLPPLAKCTANYANSVLAKTEALSAGYDEAILLNVDGRVAEGPGENLFMVKDGQLYTVPNADNALKGITCQTIKQLAKDLGIPVTEKSMIRDELFIADELFFTGTAAEVTPIREINGRVIGAGKRGPITTKLQAAYFDIVKGKNSRYEAWLDRVSSGSNVVLPAESTLKD